MSRAHSTDASGATSYWIVVKRGKNDVREVLEIAFQGRGAYTVIDDRRMVAQRRSRKAERRHADEELRLRDFLIAERQD